MKNKIFCIGLGRTGTTTFQDCMEILGYRHRGWSGPELGLLAMIDFQSILPIIEGYESFDDYPFPLIYKELFKIYPDAKFILTKRKNIDSWVNSVINESNRKKHNDSDNIWYEGDLNLPHRRELLSKRYLSHIASCRSFFARSPNFLEVCWEDGDGWEKLCNFLNKPIPNQKLPHRNKTIKSEDKDLIESLLSNRKPSKVLLKIKESNDSILKEFLIEKLNCSLKSKKTPQKSNLLNLLVKLIKGY